jgi:hypothetical protein
MTYLVGLIINKCFAPEMRDTDEANTSNRQRPFSILHALWVEGAGAWFTSACFATY